MNKTYIPTIIVLLSLSILHFLASEKHWYYQYHGFDIFMHILGGIGLALAIYWILATLFKTSTPSFWTIVALTFLAGVAWEVMECIYDIAGAPLGTMAYYVDTAKDICNDTLGAIIAYFFLER